MTAGRLNAVIGVLLIVAAVAGGGSVVIPRIAADTTFGTDGTAIDAIQALQNIRSNDALYLFGYVLDAIANLAVVALAAPLYILLRGRGRMAAGVTAAGLVATGAVLMVVSAIGFAAHTLSGKLPDVLPPDAQSLGAAIQGSAGLTAIAVLGGGYNAIGHFATAVGYSFGAITLIVLGLLLARSSMTGGATEAGSTVPRWIGWLTVAAGVAILTIWLALLNTDLFVLTVIGIVLTLLAELAIAGWLLRGSGEAGMVE